MTEYAETPLFDGWEPSEQLPDPLEGLSADRRRTARQQAAVARGVHPLALVFAGIRMHPEADRDATATDGHNLPLRCGSCFFRQVLPWHNRAYPKCVNPGQQSADAYVRHGAPYISHSAATDVRAWWPACTSYSPGDAATSPDAARYIPQTLDEED